MSWPRLKSSLAARKPFTPDPIVTAATVHLIAAATLEVDHQVATVLNIEVTAF